MGAEQERAEWRGGRGEGAERLREASLAPQPLRAGRLHAEDPRPPSGETAKILDLDLKLGIFSEMQMKITSVWGHLKNPPGECGDRDYREEDSQTGKNPHFFNSLSCVTVMSRGRCCCAHFAGKKRSSSWFSAKGTQRKSH